MNAATVIKQFESLPPDEKRKVRQFVLGAQAGTNGAAKGVARKPDLHPGAMEMASDFDAPLSEGFWMGNE